MHSNTQFNQRCLSLDSLLKGQEGTEEEKRSFEIPDWSQDPLTQLLAEEEKLLSDSIFA